MSLAQHVIHFWTSAEHHFKPVSSLRMQAIWVQAVQRSTAVLHDKSNFNLHIA